MTTTRRSNRLRFRTGVLLLIVALLSPQRLAAHANVAAFARPTYHGPRQQQQKQQRRQKPWNVLSISKQQQTAPGSTVQELTDPELSATRNVGASFSTLSSVLRSGGSMIGTVVLLFMMLFSSPSPPPANAASYASMSDEQRVVAEAWRLVDNSFLDRTFNHQDWFALRQKYVHNNKKVYANMDDAHAAIAAMVSTLGDKYTRYLTPAQYQSLVDSATGTLAGVGLEISVNAPNDTNGAPQRRIVVSDVQDASPALAAGIAAGDAFVQVDGVVFGPTSTPDDVAVQLRGPVNSKVGVVLERNGKSMDYILQRKPITITAVKSYMSNGNPSSLPPGKVGVVRIKNFSGTTAATVATAWNQLQKQGAQSLVIDIRGNPGGLLPGGVDTAALFLEADAPVVFVVNKAGIVDAQATYTTGVDTTIPIVVLVDENTASAAEVFGAALQENGRAVIAGQQTFGKGIVQTVRELSGGRDGGIAITVARYETPLHHNINQQGIAVDVKTPVDCPKTDAMVCLKGANNLVRKPT